MELILCDLNTDMVQAWRRFCGDLDFVAIEHGTITDVTCDAVVSPANSFGFMDGGVDAVYLAHFGPSLQTRVQRQIEANHAGELLVGAADIVETNHKEIPFLVVAPTMRVPMVLRESVNPYLAMRAALLLVLRGTFTSGPHHGEPVQDYVQTMAVPGLGTGVGQMSPNVSAHQIRRAIDDIALGQYTMPQSWVEASERHQLLYTTRISRLQQG